MLQPIDVLPATAVSPDAEALWTEERSLSWTELEARSRRFAQGLRKAGVDEGETWAVLATNRFEWGEMSIGNGRAGSRYVPLNWHLTAAEITEPEVKCTEYVAEGKASSEIAAAPVVAALPGGFVPAEAVPVTANSNVATIANNARIANGLREDRVNM